MAPVKMIKRQARAYLLSTSKELLCMRSEDKQRMEREESEFIGDLLFKGKELNCEESCLHSDSAVLSALGSSIPSTYYDRDLVIISSSWRCKYVRYKKIMRAEFHAYPQALVRAGLVSGS